MLEHEPLAYRRPNARRGVGDETAQPSTLFGADRELEYLPTAMDLALVNFDDPAEVRSFAKGKFELYRVGPTTLGRATYEPGWKWSEHVGPSTGETSCQVEHVGLVLSGRAVAKMDDGCEVVMRAGDFFYIPPGHDSWVVGEEPYVSLHILGSEQYATS
jgi:mannose-6-phosphate isomerase-like protein (cupin superfamily)